MINFHEFVNEPDSKELQSLTMYRTIIDSIRDLIQEEERLFKDKYRNNQYPEEYLSDSKYLLYTRVSSNEIKKAFRSVGVSLKYPQTDHDTDSDSSYTYYDYEYILSEFAKLDDLHLFYTSVYYVKLISGQNKFFNKFFSDEVNNQVQHWKLERLSQLIENGHENDENSNNDILNTDMLRTQENQL